MPTQPEIDGHRLEMDLDCLKHKLCPVCRKEVRTIFGGKIITHKKKWWHLKPCPGSGQHPTK